MNTIIEFNARATDFSKMILDESNILYFLEGLSTFPKNAHLWVKAHELRNFKNNKDMEMLPIISIIAKTAIPLTGTMIACRSAIAGDYFTAAFLASGSYALYKTFDHGVNKELAGVRQKLLNVKPSENSVAPSTSP